MVRLDDAEGENAQVLFEVTDTGIGIAADDQHRCRVLCSG